MKILVIGGGGREHALCWKISQSPLVTEIHAFPGNAGIAEIARIPRLPDDTPESLLEYARRERFDLTVVGPERYLALGIADSFAAEGLPLFGVRKEASRLEASKVFAKEVMVSAGIPTARFAVVSSYEEGREIIRSFSYPLVLKADGLAEGKGVTIVATLSEAEKELQSFLEGKFKEAGKRVVVEEFLEGEELSLILLTDGVTWRAFPFSQDHKRAFEGDTGPNTGGMGAYAPVSIGTPDILTRCEREIVAPLLLALRERGIEYRGVLYVGLMIVKGNPFVLEFNVRLGDPEAEVLLTLLESDLVPYLQAVVTGKLHETLPMQFRTGVAATVVVASAGYPGSYGKGKVIRGLESVDPMVTVFHAGTALGADGTVVTNGGRVFMVTATGDTIFEAVTRACRNAERVTFDGAFFRRDIGYRELERAK